MNEMGVARYSSDTRSMNNKKEISDFIKKQYGREVIFTVGNPHEIILDMDKKITLRQYYIGQALVHMSPKATVEEVAEGCLKLADAIIELEEREKNDQSKPNK